MVSVRERPPAADGDEAGIAVFGEDHGCSPSVAFAQTRLILLPDMDPTVLSRRVHHIRIPHKGQTVMRFNCTMLETKKQRPQDQKIRGRATG